MKKVGSGQITITDLIDGELTVELSSNLSRVQLYSSSAGLSPDWTVENLRLTPIVRFNGSIIDINNKDLTISYLKKVNSQSVTVLDGTSELIDEATKELVVNQNNLNKEDSENILYICSVSYRLNNNLFSCQNSMMFSLLKNGQNGGDAYTLLLTNENHSFAGSESAALASEVTTNIIGYKGSIEQNVKIKKVNNRLANTSSTATGITGLNFKVSSTEAVRQPSITFYATTSLAVKNGTIPIIVEIDGKEFTKNFSFTVSYKGTAGEPASLITATASQQYFKSTDGGSNYSPDIITITPTMQNCMFNNWYYSTNGGTSWTQITRTTSSTVWCYYDETTKVLSVPKEFSGYNNGVTAVSFKCDTNKNNVYDIVTIAKIADVTDMDIGVTNYILNSDFTDGLTSWSKGIHISTVTWGTKKAIRCYDNVIESGSNFSQTRTNIWFTSPKEFTLSFDALARQVDTAVLEHNWRINVTLYSTSGSSNHTFYETIGGTKERHSITISSTKENITGFKVLFEVYGNVKCDVLFTNFQLVLGKKDTDWKPAPEDSFKIITNLQTKYDTEFYDENGLMAMQSRRIDTVTTALTDKDGNIINVNSEVETLTGRIETAEGNIALSVTRENLSQGIKDGTALSLNANMVRIAWNQVSSYWEFVGSGNERGLNLYYSGKNRIFNFNDNYLSFYDASGTYNSSSSSYTTYDKLLSRFDRNDWIFYTGQESISPNTSTSKYKVCSIGRNYFQIFDGTSSSTRLALFDNNGVQLNDQNGTKSVLVDANGLTKYKTDGNLACRLGSSGLTLWASTSSNSNAKAGSYLANVFKNDNSQFGLSVAAEYDATYLSLGRRETASADSFTGFITYYNKAYNGWNKNTIVVTSTMVSTQETILRNKAKSECDFFVSPGKRMLFNGTIDIGLTNQDSDVCFHVPGKYGDSVRFRYYDSSNNTNYTTGQVVPRDGTMWMSGTCTFGGQSVGSDGRIKDDIYDSTYNALSIIEKLTPREYITKRDGEYVPIGFIAQEVKEIAPFLVDTTFINEDNAMYTLRLEKMVYVSYKAIKELKAIVDKQQKIINDLLPEDYVIEELNDDIENCIDLMTDYNYESNINLLENSWSEEEELEAKSWADEEKNDFEYGTHDIIVG